MLVNWKPKIRSFARYLPDGGMIPYMAIDVQFGDGMAISSL